MYDYLIVGSGLFGAIFAHETKKLVNLYWYLNAVTMLVEISTAKKGMASISISTVPIFSIRRIRMCGSM